MIGVYKHIYKHFYKKRYKNRIHTELIHIMKTLVVNIIYKQVQN